MNFPFNRRRFLQTSAALPFLSAARSVFGAAAPAATGAVPAIGYIDTPASVTLLNGNEYPSGPTPAAVAIMNQMATNGNRYYMPETAKFTKEVAAYHDLKPEYVTIYAGSSPILHNTALAYTSPTKALVTADPTFETTWRVAASQGAKIHKVPLNADWSYNMKAMLAADPNPGLFYICNPNNPTGTLVKKADIEWLLANKPAGSIVMVDEAYIHFSDAESVMDLVAKDKDLIVSRTFSKIYSMGGLRFGYAAARPDIMEKLKFYGVNSMPTTAIQCAKVQLNDKQLVPLRKQAMADSRNRTFDWLAKQGYEFSPSQANHFLLNTKKPGSVVANALAHQSVMIGRTWAAMPNWPRVTVGSMSEMQSFQSALVEAMKMPDGKMNALAHPMPHLINEHSC